MKAKYLKPSFYKIGNVLEPYIKIWQNYLNVGQILAIENLKKKHMILAILIFNIYSCLGGKKKLLGKQ